MRNDEREGLLRVCQHSAEKVFLASGNTREEKRGWQSFEGLVGPEAGKVVFEFFRRMITLSKFETHEDIKKFDQFKLLAEVNNWQLENNYAYGTNSLSTILGLYAPIGLLKHLGPSDPWLKIPSKFFDDVIPPVAHLILNQDELAYDKLMAWCDWEFYDAYRFPQSFQKVGKARDLAQLVASSRTNSFALETHAPEFFRQVGVIAKSSVKNALGQNALHIAVESGSFSFARVLIENGFSLEQEDAKGKTLLTLCDKQERLILENKSQMSADLIDDWKDFLGYIKSQRESKELMRCVNSNMDSNKEETKSRVLKV